MNLLSNNLRPQILAFLEECCEPREKSIKSSMCSPHEGYTGTIRNNIYLDLKKPDTIWFFDDCLSCVARKETRLAGDTPTGIELH